MNTPTRVAPATKKVNSCEIVLSAATRLIAICGADSKKTATSTTTT